MLTRMSDMQWGYVGGTNHIFSDYQIRFAKRLGTEETVTIVQSLSLVKGKGDNQLYIYEDGEQVGHTSPIVSEEWLENCMLGDEQFALVKCFTTQSGSKYFFAPLALL